LVALHRAAILFWDALDATGYRNACHRRERCAAWRAARARRRRRAAATRIEACVRRAAERVAFCAPPRRHREQWVYLFVPFATLVPVCYALRTLPLPAPLQAVVAFLSLVAITSFALTAAMDPGARPACGAARAIATPRCSRAAPRRAGVVPKAGAPGALPPPPPGARLQGGPLASSSSASALVDGSGTPVAPVGGPAFGGGGGVGGGGVLWGPAALRPRAWDFGRDPSAHRWCEACEVYRPPRASHWCAPAQRRSAQRAFCDVG
jgi:hypothetical protein